MRLLNRRLEEAKILCAARRTDKPSHRFAEGGVKDPAARGGYGIVSAGPQIG